MSLLRFSRWIVDLRALSLVCLALLLLCTAGVEVEAQDGARPKSVTTSDGQWLTGIMSVNLQDDGRVSILYSEGNSILDAAKLPEEFRIAWGLEGRVALEGGKNPALARLAAAENQSIVAALGGLESFLIEERVGGLEELREGLAEWKKGRLDQSEVLKRIGAKKIVRVLVNFGAAKAIKASLLAEAGLSDVAEVRDYRDPLIRRDVEQRLDPVNSFELAKRVLAAKAKPDQEVEAGRLALRLLIATNGDGTREVSGDDLEQIATRGLARFIGDGARQIRAELRDNRFDSEAELLTRLTASSQAVARAQIDHLMRVIAPTRYAARVKAAEAAAKAELTAPAQTSDSSSSAAQASAASTQSGSQAERPRKPTDLVDRKSRQRFWKLSGMARDAFDNGDLARARELAEELLTVAPLYRGDWNYGNALFHANLILGRVALAKDDQPRAVQRLIDASFAPGSPQLSEYGPNTALAEELLKKGEKKAVLNFLDNVAKFWKTERAKKTLQEWRAAIDAGDVPDFGPHQRY